MPRKGNAKLNTLPKTEMKDYEVFINQNELGSHVIVKVQAGVVYRDGDDLVFLKEPDGDELAVFKEWLYFKCLSLV